MNFLQIENPMVLGQIEFPTSTYEPDVIFDMYDDFGSFVAIGDVYFEIGDAIVHIDNISDYLATGYKDESTYDMNDPKLISYVQEHYGTAFTKK